MAPSTEVPTVRESIPTTVHVKARSQALDILRAIAVSLVLLRHAHMYSDSKMSVTPLAAFFGTGGWIGVDLFFVLSGFLISQLLFKEHKKFGSISYRTFLIRRGFKIYPPYYVMMLVTTLVLCAWNTIRFRQVSLWLLPWLFYLQNYVDTPLTFIWGHTWSLAVEEQFYFLLPLVLILLAKIEPVAAHDPFRLIPSVFVSIGLACLLARIINAAIPFNGMIHLTPFHIRADSLFCGVFVSYLYHYCSLTLFDAVKRLRYLLLSAGIALILPAFLFQLSTSPFIYTFGYTFLYVGNGLIMATAIVSDWTRTNVLANIVAYVGSRSYSIYLWHFPLAWFMQQSQAHLSMIPPNWSYPIYLIVSIGFGIFVSNIIEMPMLKWRDRLYPSRST
jgi:peptidoglycan/LPS O-acetylase OafA/YrhL